MNNFISVSNHTESYLTASTIDSFLERSKSLGLSHFAVTDQGFLGSVLKTYHMAKKKDIKVIAGMEIYFRDSNCEILRGTEADKCKFFQLFVHCLDQPAYQALVKLTSKDRPIPLTINEQEYPLFDWSDLEELSKFNVTITTSGVNCLVGKQFLLGRGDLGLKIVNKLINMFGSENLYLSIIPNKYTHYWDSIVTATLGYDKVEMTANQQLHTNYRGISRASDLAKLNTKHFMVKGILINKTLFPVNKKVYGKATIKNSFTELPNDLQRMVNKYFDAISKKTGCRLLLNSYSFFANDGDKIVQDMKLGDEDRVYQSYHIQSGDEARNYLVESLGYTDEKVESVINNNLEWANRFNDFELKYEYRLVDYGDTPEKILMERIKSKGRMKWDNPIYIEQMDREIDILVNNGIKNLVPYFLPIEEMIEHYTKNMQLVNVGRGSSAGFLLSYLLGITQIDPIRYGLSSERFITLDRIRNSGLPDIDMDFNSRILLVGEDGNGGFLNNKYGKKFAQVSTRTLLRLKSAILDANRFTNGGETEDSIVAFAKSLPSAPQGISDSDFIFGYENSDGEHVEGILEKSEELQEYAIARPSEWSIVQKAVSLVRQRSRHASAFCIADVNIDEIVPTMQIGEVKKVTQYEAKQCEIAGLIKYDFLCIKVLDDIQGAINLINKKMGIVETEAGYFQHEGKRTYIWDIPEDPNVFLDMQKGNTETVFQFNTTSVTPFLMKMKPSSLMDLSATTALIRPGPLGFISPETGRNMADEFVERKFGRSVGRIEILNSMFPETYGILTYQEQISRIAKELGLMSVEDSENVRVAMGKKKMKELEAMKPQFLRGAITKVDEATANTIWEMMVEFAKYSFNFSHSLSYSYTGYACAFLKYHYRLEWFASVISEADSVEINEVLYKHIRNILTPPDINLSEESMVIDYEASKIRSKLSILNGISDNLSSKIQAGRPYTDIKDFLKKKICGDTMTKKLVHIGVMDSILPTGLNLEEKIKLVNQAFIDVAYEEKIANGIKAKKPKTAICDPDYLMLSNLKDFQMKKAVYPTMNLELDVIMREGTTAMSSGDTLMIGGKDYKIRNSEYLSENENKIFDKNIDFAIAGYVLELGYFTYANDTKKACKMTIDSSGYVSEKVIWPNKETGVLSIPDGLEKGAVAWFCYTKRAKKVYTNIDKVYIEKYSIISRKKIDKKEKEE